MIGSHFHNDSNENKISEADNPYGYGLVISKGITKDFSIALTGEYMQGDLKADLVKKKIFVFTLRELYIHLHLILFNHIYRVDLFIHIATLITIATFKNQMTPRI
ncbi:MAG: hypothetical protein H6613_07410 [Ignavibacteriales bacterium]|nr:hypothetical protein [Ignavibacteriales bacterium]